MYPWLKQRFPVHVFDYKKPTTCGILHTLDRQQTAYQDKMLLACLIVASVGQCLGDQFEVVDERLAVLEKKMMGLEEENKYLRLVFSYGSV